MRGLTTKRSVGVYSRKYCTLKVRTCFFCPCPGCEPCAAEFEVPTGLPSFSWSPGHRRVLQACLGRGERRSTRCAHSISRHSTGGGEHWQWSKSYTIYCTYMYMYMLCANRTILRLFAQSSDSTFALAILGLPVQSLDCSMSCAEYVFQTILGSTHIQPGTPSINYGSYIIVYNSLQAFVHHPQAVVG